MPQVLSLQQQAILVKRRAESSPLSEAKRPNVAEVHFVPGASISRARRKDSHYP
jgi:hypothetical protein